MAPAKNFLVIVPVDFDDFSSIEFDAYLKPPSTYNKPS